VIAAVDAARLEKELHSRFWRQRSHGEWFRPEGGLVAFIKASAQQLETEVKRKRGWAALSRRVKGEARRARAYHETLELARSIQRGVVPPKEG
jgi:hypothetical protein